MSCQVSFAVGDENPITTPQKVVDAESKSTDASCKGTPASVAEMVTPPLKEVTNCTASTGLTPTPVQDASAGHMYGNDDDDVNDSYCLNPLFSPTAERTRTKKELLQTPQRKLPQRQWAVPDGVSAEAPDTPDAVSEADKEECATPEIAAASPEATEPELATPADDVLAKLEQLSTEDSSTVTLSA